jgi:hypothetical protein
MKQYNTESRKKVYTNWLEIEKVKRIDCTLRRNCLLKYIVGGKIAGRDYEEEG